MTTASLPAGAARPTAAPTLVVAWLLTLAATRLGNPHDTATIGLVMAFLLWRTWRGARWSRTLLLTASAAAAGIVAAIGIAVLLGATGIVAPTAVALAGYAAVGALLCLPAVRALAAQR